MKEDTCPDTDSVDAPVTEGETGVPNPLLASAEARYRTLVERSPGAITLHRHGKIIYVNPAAIKLFGAVSAEQLIGKPILDLVHPDFHEITLARVKSIFDDGVPTELAELKYLQLDGSTIDVEVQGICSLFDGAPAAQVAIRDITDRKQAEARLRDLNFRLNEKSEMLQTTLASISQGVLVVDGEGRISAFNPRVCELLDLPESLLTRRPTIREITRIQYERGDYCNGAQGIETAASELIANDDYARLPLNYVRKTPSGRTLEVKTKTLPSGGMVRTFADVTDYVQAEDARQRVTQLLETTQAMARVGGWEIDVVNGKVLWTHEVFRMLDTSPQEYTPTQTSIVRFFTPAALAVVTASYADLVNQPEHHDFEVEMVTAKGRHIWVHSIGTTQWENGRPVKRIATVQDVTERKLAQAALLETEDRWKLALESAGDGMWDWYVQDDREYFSKRLLDMYGLGDDEQVNRRAEIKKLCHPDDRAELENAVQNHFQGLTPTYQNEHRVRCRDGSWKWVLSRGMVISRDALGQPLRMTGTHTDITERKRSESLIWEQANFDALTGLPNRRLLRERLEQEIKKSRRDGLQLAILFIDLDHFKEVNDTLGHDSGDQLLIEATRRIKECLRESDTVARMGGDEFTVILTEIFDVGNIERILQKLLSTLATVFRLGEEQVFVSASIGVTMYPFDATAIEDLFKNADQALYVAKGAGRNRFSFFTPALQEAAQTRVRLANDLRVGLAEQQFRVVYQPIIEMSTGAIHKAEALIRWDHPQRGLVSPAEFIPIAEASGLIVDIGQWVFQQAAAQVLLWRQSLNPNFQISINKSPVQFNRDGNVNLPWSQQLQALGLPGQAIVVEITEGLLLDTTSSVADQLLDLRDAGIQMSLDDFGTGYSSLSYLQKFDIDFIKIDQSFVRHLIPESTDLALCKAIIVMAHALGMRVIAEGVETMQQRDLLAEAGCDYGQGYFFSKPISAVEFEAFALDQPL